MPAKKKPTIRGGRTKFAPHVTESSKKYLRRQDKDPYVNKARKMGFRSRAAFKLLEINEKYRFLKPGMDIADLGAAPGSWCQVVQKKFKGKGTLIALDKLPIEPLADLTFVQGDFNDDEIYQEFLSHCPNGLDVVLCDIAPETSGHTGHDHLRAMALAELAWDFALNNLKPNGFFVCKIFQGGEEAAFRNTLQKHFKKVAFEKPASSRKESREIFLVGAHFISLQ